MKLSKLSCAVLSVIVLSACGGGGGSSDSHNNQVEPQPQPIEEAGVVVQDFQFNAFSTLDVADIITGGNFDSNSKTTVCLDTNGNNSCNGENYSVSGTGLTFSDKLEWPEDLDVSGMNIIADNNNFIYSIPADSGIYDVAAQRAVQKRIKVYINPASNALHADKLGKDVILGGYTGAKYSSSDFSAQKDYSSLDQEIITFADTLVSVLNYSSKEKLAYTEVRDIVSGALQKIIDALKDLSVSPVQIVVSVDTHNDYNHLANNGNPVTNNPPVADFNFEVSADGVVNFTNNSSDPENDKLIYKWKFGDNAESDEVSPTHKYKNNGKYTVYLNVTDSGNLSNYITKEVNVDSISEGGNDNPDTPIADENNAPIANFYYEDTDEGLLKFTNNSSDPDNDKLTYKWNFGDNSESNKKSPNHTFKKNGKYTVTLTVTDSHNLTSTVTKDVIVASVSAIDPPVENSAPVANFSYEDTDEGLVTFSNNSSDPDNDKLTYKWNFGDNSESNKKSPNHTFKKNGKYTVTLTVTDSHNLTNTITKDIIVASVSAIDPPEENSAPVANFSYSVGYNLKVTFINTSTDSNGDELSSFWCIEGIECFAQTDDLEYTFSQAGIYRVSLLVNDGNKESTVTHDVVVAERMNPDTPDICSNGDTLHLDVDVDMSEDVGITFHNKSYDEQGYQWSYRWQFNTLVEGSGILHRILPTDGVVFKQIGDDEFESSANTLRIKYNTELVEDADRSAYFPVSLIATDACGYEKKFDVSVRLYDSLYPTQCKSINYTELRKTLSEATMIGDVECRDDIDDGISVGLLRDCQWLPDTKVAVRLSDDKDGISDMTYKTSWEEVSVWGNDIDKCQQIIKHSGKNGAVFDRIACGELTEKEIKSICIVPRFSTDGTQLQSFDDKYLIVNHDRSVVPLAVPADGADVINVNTVTSAAARVGVKRLLKNYTGSKYSEETFSSANSYEQLDDNIKIFGDTVFYLLQLVHKGELSLEELQTRVFDGLEAIVESKAQGITDDQIMHNVVKYADYEHLKELQPYSGNNSAPVADAECNLYTSSGRVALHGLSSDSDGDELSLKWLHNYFPGSYNPQNYPYLDFGRNLASGKVELLQTFDGINNEWVYTSLKKGEISHVITDKMFFGRMYYRVSDGKTFKFNSIDCERTYIK